MLSEVHHIELRKALYYRLSRVFRRAGVSDSAERTVPLTCQAARTERAGGDGNLEGAHRGGSAEHLAVHETPRGAAGGIVKGRAREAAVPRPKAPRGKRAQRKAAKIVAAGRANAPVELMRIRELDPQAACGEGTTVMQLFRVDDLPFGDDTTHLVFYDRHGWYCAHGRECPAVAAVRKRFKPGTQTK